MRGARLPVWAQPEGVLCRVHQRQWIRHGRPGLDEWLARSAHFRPGLPVYEQVDLRGLPPALKLEMQYALQRRRDDETVKVRPREVRGAVGFLRDAQPGSLLGPGLDGIAVTLRYARRVLEDLAEGTGWDAEYPRDTWKLRRLGISGKCATIRFGSIIQPWLEDLAKRSARWRLSTGVPGERAHADIRAVTRLAGFLAARDVTALAQVDRALLERYLADLHREFAGRDIHGKQIGQLAAFLADTRQHGWDATLPADAALCPEDYPAAPQAGSALPRHVAEHVMQHVEDEARLARWDSPAYRLITLILVQCGLRISSALTLAFDCVARDSRSAPYLRYYNTKMKREALVPIDEQLAAEIHGQQERLTSRWRHWGLLTFRPGTLRRRRISAKISDRGPETISSYYLRNGPFLLLRGEGEIARPPDSVRGHLCLYRGPLAAAYHVGSFCRNSDRAADGNHHLHRPQ